MAIGFNNDYGQIDVRSGSGGTILFLTKTFTSISTHVTLFRTSSKHAQIEKSELVVSSREWTKIMNLAVDLEAQLPVNAKSHMQKVVEVVAKEVGAIKRLNYKLKVRVRRRS